jgi:agmatinase
MIFRSTAPEPEPLELATERLARGEPPRSESGFLGADPDPSESALVLLSVPWEVTTSYGSGTAAAPDAIRRASHQLDLEDGAFPPGYLSGISMLIDDGSIAEMNATCRPLAAGLIAAMGAGRLPDPALLERVNLAGESINRMVRLAAGEWLAAGKSVAVVGGDHSCPYGLIEALAEEGEPFGILHVDAHHDLRNAYEGFRWSHASIFYNVLARIPQVTRLVQVAIRDYSAGERAFAAGDERVTCHYSDAIFRQRAAGVPYAEICRRIIESLPDRVYISFDIDGLDPANCPSTGTPVPGGLSYEEACYLIEELVGSGREVIGFDLCEVTPDPSGGEWDANVGARILYKLCNGLLASRQGGSASHSSNGSGGV